MPVTCCGESVVLTVQQLVPLGFLTCGRPETVESLFIAYRLTGDPKYRDWGWGIFSAIEEHCKVPSGGYASIINVDAVPAEQEDKMETFLMVSNIHLLVLRQ